MLWKTHIAISTETLRRVGINLSRETYERYKAGVIAPDQWQDYPHHHGKSNEIANNLMFARQSYLKNNMTESFYYLGVAFHYIQDAYTSVASYKSRHKQFWHHNYEQGIEDAPFVEDISKTIQYHFRDDYSQLNKFSQIERNLSQKVEGKNATLQIATMVGKYPCDQTGKPVVDRNLALLACVGVMESILGPKTNNQLDSALDQSLIYYENLLHQTELSISHEIVNMVDTIETIQSERDLKSGIVPKLKNGLLSLRLKIKQISLNSKYNRYVKKSHLLEVSSQYKQTTDGIIGPELGWYLFSRPELDLNSVKSELIPFKEPYKDVIAKNKIKCYNIGNKKLVVRQDIVPYINV
jgi:hypothetical protein